MKTTTPFLLISLTAALLAPMRASADGMFVAPKFVWDKHKDINEPTQKAILVYDAGREDLLLQVKYEGPVNEFGWLVPVPGLPTVKEGSMKCFYELSEFTQRLWEHPVFPSHGDFQGPVPASVAAPLEPPVKVIETKTVGAYEVAVLSAKDSDALARWLDANQFYFPADQNGVIDSYVKQQWYFVAVRINLSKASGFQFLSSGRAAPVGPAASYATHLKLASGELNPLQISFASDRCVFPLKISSLNGQPSEIQLYVLSSAPLLERAMFEKKLPEIYRQDLARTAENARQAEQYQMRRQSLPIPIGGRTRWYNPLSFRSPPGIQKMRHTPEADPGELPPYAKVSKADLPVCGNAFSRLANKSWWLTKQTWTFKPEDMRDLVFEPVMDVFADLLSTRYGYFAAIGLAHFQSDAVPALLAAMRNSNPAVRATAASLFNRHDSPEDWIRDPRLTVAAVGWLKDSSPEVRMAGINVLADSGQWKKELSGPLLATLRDKDQEVRREAVFVLPRYRDELVKFAPVFQQMLEDRDPGLQSEGLQMLQDLGLVVPRASLLRFFDSSDPETLASAFQQMTRQREEMTGDDIAVLLRNSQPVARQFGLVALSQRPEKSSVALALPLLRDSDEIVRLQAGQTLRWLTGQPFSEDQADKWAQWWANNKTKFVARTHPEAWRGPQEGRPYHDGGCELYNRRDFVEALGDFRKACELGSAVRDYSQYRIWIIRARSGEKEIATRELAAYLKNRQPRTLSDWPVQIGRFLTGQITESELLNAAVSPNPETNREQHCEAYFYAGARRLVENDELGAADCFQKCLATKVTDFEEYDSAAAELKALR